ncbi:MAG: response regulator [Lachnospiraceae bacterium]|nr:response regulator [Lachnospiraceae bacterium]
MIVFVVDDEPLAVESLKLNITRALGDDVRIETFTNPQNVSEQARVLKPDIVFLDIEMPGTNGMDLAAGIKSYIPGAIIIFVTAYSEYAFKAWELRVDGYLLKPASAGDITAVLDDIRSKRRMEAAAEPLLKVRCFGRFEVFSGSRPVKFKRSRAQEVLAYLVSARGARVTSGELCGVLWEDSIDISRKKAYLRQYVQALREALEKCSAVDVLRHERDAYSIDPALIDCDYYRYLAGERDDAYMYHGEFMSQYSWSEEISAELSEFT